MLPKASIEHIVAKQRKALYDMPAGHPREISGSLLYLSDRPLLIGGMRGSGRAMLLGRMLKDEYPEAWYTDFDDPRLAGFDESDFAKLDRLIREREPYYAHTLEGDDDMPAHAKSTLAGVSLTIPITAGRLNLGLGQGVYLCEFRNHGGARRIVATVVG